MTPCYKFKVYSLNETNKKEKVYRKKVNGRNIYYVKEYL